ncbi:MAG TPA: hypothetical protein VHT04_14995, partial [Stellaceae bacterium]|nr:hypothetical protein [Stellaceae bacterium]
ICAGSPTLAGEPASLIAETLGEIGVLKTYRDAVVHAKIHDPKAKIARTSIKHGKPYEVDISVPTLKALYQRIMGLQKEMVASLRMIERHFTEDDLETQEYSGPNEVINGPFFQEHLAEFRERRSSRTLLPTIPPLNEES